MTSSNTRPIAASRPPEARSLNREDLAPADILLSRGTSPISDLIVAADGGSFSHAALWTGSTVIEATIQGGVQERAPSGRRFVHRYRALEGDDGETERWGAVQAQRVVDCARRQVGQRYDTAEIHLLAVVFHKWWPFARPRRALGTALLETLGGASAPVLIEWLQHVYQRAAPRICSELVALAYFQGGRPLSTIGAEKRPPWTSTPPVETSDAPPEDSPIAPQLEGLRARIGAALWSDERAAEAVAAALGVEHDEARGLLLGNLAYDFDSGVPVGVVTPGDLQFSPSLELIGCLDSPAE